jgi:hypothetical protein
MKGSSTSQSQKATSSNAPPQQEALAVAVETLTTTSTVVIDLVALATLRLLGVTRQVLTSGFFRFIISPATYAELQQLRVQSRFRVAYSTLNYENGQHFFTQTTDEQAERQRASFEEWMKCIEENTTIVLVPEITALPAERRDSLEKVFGRYGLEAALLANPPGHVLWTDDGIFAQLAKTELSTNTVWTQAVLESMANRRLLDRTITDECHAKLLGFSYYSTHFTGVIVVAALRVSRGSVTSFPMKQAISAFKSVVLFNRAVSLHQLTEFILQISLEPMLPETKCVALESLLGAFPKDHAVRVELISVRNHCARIMTLNPIEQRRFLICFDRWLRKQIIDPFMIS